MPATSVIRLEENHFLEALEAVLTQLDESGSERVLDLSGVHRLDARLLALMRDLAQIAQDKQCTVTLRALNVEVYKALKLARLTSSFSFLD